MALIKTIAEFKKYIPVDANMKMATLESFIDDAESTYIIKLLGQAFYDEFLSAYLASVSPSPTALDSDKAALLPYIQRPLAYYAQLHAIPHLTVTFGDMGIMQNRGEMSDPAPRWKEEKLQFNALSKGDMHADKLLEYLEANASGSKYATWFNSTANTKKSGLIVYSTAVASKHIRINNSRRMYLALYETIKSIEAKTVPRLVGQEQYDVLVTALKAGNATADQKNLIARIEPIIAKRALFYQIQFLRVQITELGLLIYSSTDELIKPNQLATDADIKILREQLKDDPDTGYLTDESTLQQWIETNIDLFPLIKASKVYTIQPDPGPTFTPRNCATNKHFIA